MMMRHSRPDSPTRHTPTTPGTDARSGCASEPAHLLVHHGAAGHGLRHPACLWLYLHKSLSVFPHGVAMPIQIIRDGCACGEVIGKPACQRVARGPDHLGCSCRLESISPGGHQVTSPNPCGLFAGSVCCARVVPHGERKRQVRCEPSGPNLGVQIHTSVVSFSKHAPKKELHT